MSSDKKAPGKRDDDTPPDNITRTDVAIIVMTFVVIMAMMYGLEAVLQ